MNDKMSDKIDGRWIFWDLDGVLRNLGYRFHDDFPDTWDEKNKDGYDIYDWIAENPDDLKNAPELEYAMVARLCCPIHIVSCQPESWRPNTSKWIDAHFDHARIKYLNNPQDKLKYLEGGKRILIEDYPNFNSYDFIILVDRRYNRTVSNVNRVHTCTELINEIIKLNKMAA